MAYPTTNGYYQPDMQQQQQQQQPLPMQQQPLPMQQPQPQQQQPPPQQQPAAMQAPAGAGGKYIPPHLRNKGMAAAEGYPAAAPAPEQNQGGCDWRNNSNNHNGNYNHQQMMVYGGNQNGYAPANNSYGYGGSGMQKGGGKGGYGGGRDGGGADGGGAYRPPHGGGSNFVRDFMNDYDKAVSGDWGNTTVQLTGKEVGGPQTDLTDARVWGSGQIAQPFTTFNSCTFPKPIMASIHSLGFSAPTAIQAYCWPVSAEGRDLIGIAKTGSGKTLAFLLPPFVKFLNTRADHRGPYMLVMAPTRELACQIQEQAEKFGRRIGIQSVCVYGGAPRYNQQREIRQGRHLIVGTPGRLNDFLESGQLGLSLCSYLVLDEADRMLDMGFEPQIRTLIQAIPEGRQTMMFSATWPREVRRLAQDYLNNPVHIQIGSHEATVNKDITQQVLIVNGQREKQERLREILTNIAPTDRVIVFVNTKRMCEQLARDLWNDRISCCTIHGDREQRERDQALAAFKSGRAPVMAATDVAARGLDIKGVKLVINFDVASNSEDHIHRIGRTGRAGEQGTAITFIDHTEAKEGREVMKTMEKVGQPVPEDLRELAYSAGGGGGMRNGRYGGKGYGKGGKGGKGGKKGGGGGYRRDDGGFGGGGGYGGRRGGGDNNRW